MNIFSKLFSKNTKEKTGGLEDFMLLISVYYQATLAAQTGLNNLTVLRDLRIFKQTYHITTQNNKIGLAEKKQCQKMLQGIYKVSENLFKEIDLSIKKRCRTPQDAQSYLIQFQGFAQELMMLMGNLMQWKSRIPSFFRKALRTMVEKQVHEIMTRNDWKDEAVRRSCISIRKYQTSLSYSEAWMSEYAYTLVMLYKKEDRPKNAEQA